MAKDKSNSLASYRLKRKLIIAFALMSVFPLLVFGVLVANYRLLPQPQFSLQINITAAISAVIFIVIIGFWLIKGIFDRVVTISGEAKLIAAGDINRKLKVESPDEVGDLSDALNQLTHRIRSNMDELKSYSEKTTEINLEIQKRVLVLSSLLQISSLISQGAKLEDILKVIIDKARLLASSDVAYLLFRESTQEAVYMKAADGINSQYLLKIKLEPKEALFENMITKMKPLILDKQNVLPENLAASFYEKFKLKNTLALPIYLRGRVMGALGIGNTKDPFIYRKDEIELLDLFAKQVAVAAENDILVHRVEKLEIRDALTGLYNASFIYNRLEEEIKRSIAYQRPCAFILIDIDNFAKFHQNFGSLQAEAVLKRVGSLIKDSVSDIDRVARTGDNEFAVVLPEKNKRKAHEMAEEIKRKIEFAFSEEQDINKRIAVSVGVSENPLDGVDGEELKNKAKERIRLAKKDGKARVG